VTVHPRTATAHYASDVVGIELVFLLYEQHTIHAGISYKEPQHAHTRQDGVFPRLQ